MKVSFLKIIIISLTGWFFFSGNPVKTVNIPQLQALAEKRANDTLYIVNFWATWCKPCVAEMPFFIEADKKYKTQKIQVIFVSLNSAKEVSKVQSFIDTKNIHNPVYLLNAGNPNDWIDKIEASWGGSIPATVMYKNGKKVFFKEGDFTLDELEKAIQKNNNP